MTLLDLLILLLPLTTLAYQFQTHAPHKRSINHQLSKRDGTFKGRATYYACGLGACGTTNTDSDFIVALNSAQYQANKWCGKTITITYGGKTHDAQIMDECPGCPQGGLDMSPALFKYFASEDAGVFYMSWSMQDGGGSSDGSSKKGPSSASSASSGDDKSHEGDEKSQAKEKDSIAYSPSPSPPPPAYNPPSSPVYKAPTSTPPVVATMTTSAYSDSPSASPSSTPKLDSKPITVSPSVSSNTTATNTSIASVKTTTTNVNSSVVAVSKGFVISNSTYGQVESTTAYATGGNLDVVSQLVVSFGSLTTACASHAISPPSSA